MSNATNTNTGKFITFEGIDGIGKSTQVDRLFEWLQKQGIDAVKTREPGGVPAAEAVRELLLSSQGVTSPISETLLLFAAREEHLQRVIRPALKAGQWVLCDRFTDSSMAYQGGGRGVDVSFLNYLATTIHGDCQPDLTFYLSPTDKLQHSLLDTFETLDSDFYERVKAAYNRLLQENPKRIIAIDRPDESLSVAESVKLMAEEIQTQMRARLLNDA